MAGDINGLRHPLGNRNGYPNQGSDEPDYPGRVQSLSLTCFRGPELLDRRLYLLDDERFTAFEAVLARPVELSAALRKTMNTPAPWMKK